MKPAKLEAVPGRAPIIYIIAGCNGAGKTTFAREYRPHEVKCLRFLNADELARGLSPLDPEAGAFKAGRLLLREVHVRSLAFASGCALAGTLFRSWIFDADSTEV